MTSLFTTHARRNTDATVVVNIRKSKHAPEWDRGALTTRCRLTTTYKDCSVHKHCQEVSFLQTLQTRYWGIPDSLNIVWMLLRPHTKSRKRRTPWSNCIILFKKKMATMAWEFKCLDQTRQKKILSAAAIVCFFLWWRLHAERLNSKNWNLPVRYCCDGGSELETS